MPTIATAALPPAYAWDWVGRQRLVWVEARRRLVPTGPAAPPDRPADVPDWSDLLDRGPVHAAPDAPADAPADALSERPVDWAALATRADVMAALRAAYPTDPAVRTAVDGAVTDVAFLGRRGGDLADLGVRTPPRGLRWWWTHLGGVVAEDGATTPGAVATAGGVQLTLADVLAGYGDPVRAG